MSNQIDERSFQDVFDAITPQTPPDADAHRDPYRSDVTAPSWRAARQQAAEEYPDCTIELVLHEDRLDAPAGAEQ